VKELVLKGHDGIIRSICFNYKSTILLSAGSGKKVKKQIDQNIIWANRKECICMGLGKIIIDEDAGGS